MPNPARKLSSIPSYQPVWALHQLASSKHPMARHIAGEYRQKLAGNSFAVLFPADIQEVLMQQQSLRPGSASYVFVLNVSGFAPVNETYQHLSGDAFLDRVQEHIEAFFKARNIEIKITRQGVNFVIAAAAVVEAEAQAMLEALPDYLAEPGRQYRVAVQEKCIAEEVRAGAMAAAVPVVTYGRPGQREKVQQELDLRTAPFYDPRQKSPAKFPRFYAGLLQVDHRFSASSHQAAVDKLIGSLNQRSKDAEGKPSEVHTQVYSWEELAPSSRAGRPYLRIVSAGLQEEEWLHPDAVQLRRFESLLDTLVEAKEQILEETPEGLAKGTAHQWVRDLNTWLNYDVKATGLRSRNAFMARLEEVRKEEKVYTVVAIDINGFGAYTSFNLDKDGVICDLGKRLGDRAIKVLSGLLEETLAAYPAEVSRTGGDELHILTGLKPELIAKILAEGLPQKLAKAAADPANEEVVHSADIPPEIKQLLADQGIYARKDGFYRINPLAVKRFSFKYGQWIEGFAVSMGAVAMYDPAEDRLTYLNDADRMSEAARKEDPKVVEGKESLEVRGKAHVYAVRVKPEQRSANAPRDRRTQEKIADGAAPQGAQPRGRGRRWKEEWRISHGR